MEMEDFSDEEMFLFQLITRQLNVWFVSHKEAAYTNTLTEKEPAASLTEREQVIVGLICKGYSTRKISETLTVTYETTRKHIANIYGKLNINSRVELVRLFLPS